MAAHPLRPPEFAAILDALGPFERRPRLAVGVSGGADSMALALLAQEWAAARGGGVLALIVDHGLRAGAADEAAATFAALAERGINGRLLRWRGVKPATGVQAAARAARRDLMEVACRDAEILHLLLAHHASDQAETVAMRAVRGSGPAGQAGMPAVVELSGLRLLRPLLGIAPERLRATLAAHATGWIEDPSNLDPRFLRTRLRQDADFDACAWWAIGRDHAVARTCRDAEQATRLATACRPHALGFAHLRLAAASPPVLSSLAVTVGGRVYPPSAAQLRRLAARLAEGTRPVSAAGCLWRACNGDVLIAREAGRISERPVLRPGDRVWWDGRFEIVYRAGPDVVQVAALGEPGRLALPAALRRRLQRAGVLPAALAALPGLFAGGVLVACPAIGYVAEAGLMASVRVRPRLPLATAPFAGANVVSNPQGLIYRARTGILRHAGCGCGPGWQFA